MPAVGYDPPPDDAPQLTSSWLGSTVALAGAGSAAIASALGATRGGLCDAPPGNDS